MCDLLVYLWIVAVIETTVTRLITVPGAEGSQLAGVFYQLNVSRESGDQDEVYYVSDDESSERGPGTCRRRGQGMLKWV